MTPRPWLYFAAMMGTAVVAGVAGKRLVLWWNFRRG